MDRVPLLVPIGGPLTGNRYQVPEGDGIYIGRGSECEISINDPEISRQHAKITLHNAGIWVQDAGSRNGVFINEKRVVRPTELRPGAKLTIGEHAFVLELAEVNDDDPSVIRPASGAVTKTDSGAMAQFIKRLPLLAVLIAVVYAIYRFSS